MNKANGEVAAEQAHSSPKTIPVNVKINGAEQNLRIKPRIIPLIWRFDFVCLSKARRGVCQ